MKRKLFLALIPLYCIFKACVCDNPEIPFSFNQSRIQLLDNSGQWVITADSDSLHAGAVAFRVAMADSTIYPLIARNIKPATFSLASDAKALSCIEKFKPTHSITQISITTLLPLNDAITGQSDVTGKFYALSTGSLYSEHLYYTIEQTIVNFNNIKYFDDFAHEELNFFLETTVQHHQAQFRIDIRFSDGTILSETTPIIQIIH
jgi:hypothetical protein